MTDILARLRGVFLDVLGIEEVAGDERLDDLDADSLERADLFIAVEEAFGVDFSDEDLDRLTSVADLVARIETLTEGETHGSRQAQV